MFSQYNTQIEQADEDNQSLGTMIEGLQADVAEK
jgi:hypothetical protein